jgi:hypothetical protein
VDATVSVVVRADGSGVVRVTVVADAEAVRAAESGGVALEQAVRLADLADSGWTVGPWVKADDGSATIVLSHPFDSVEQVAGIVAGLNGDAGPLPALEATRDEGLFGTEFGATGRIDIPGASARIADDAELLANLGALGVDVNVIDQQLLAQIQSSFTLTVIVQLPEQQPITFTSEPGKQGGPASQGERAVPTPGVAKVVTSGSVQNTERILFLVAAIGFGVLAMLVWSRGRRRRRRAGRRPPPRRPSPTARRGAGRGAPEPPARRVPPRPSARGQTQPRGRNPGAGPGSGAGPGPRPGPRGGPRPGPGSGPGRP